MERLKRRIENWMIEGENELEPTEESFARKMELAIMEEMRKGLLPFLLTSIALMLAFIFLCPVELHKMSWFRFMEPISILVAYIIFYRRLAASYGRIRDLACSRR